MQEINETSMTNRCKINVRKHAVKSMNFGPKRSQIGGQNPLRIHQNRGPKFDVKKGRDDAKIGGVSGWSAGSVGGRRVGRDATSNILNISKRHVNVF